MKLKQKIMLVALAPIIILGVVVTLLTSNRATTAIKNEVAGSLEANAISLRDAIEMGTPGDYTLESDGALWKGDFDVTNSQMLIDNVRDATGILMTVTYGDNRVITGLLNEDGSYAVGTKIGQTAIDEVLTAGNNYMSENVNVNGEDYYAYYIPIFNEGSDKPIGTIFAGKSQAEVKKAIQTITIFILVAVAILMVFSAIVVGIIVSRVTNAISDSVKVVQEVAGGNLAVDIPKKHLKRKDEIGSLSKAVENLVLSLEGIVSHIKNQSVTLIAASNGLDSTAQNTTNVISQVELAVQEVAEGATSQAGETQKATDNVIFMGDMVQETSSEADNLHKNAEDMKKLSASATEILNDLKKSSEHSSEAIEVIYKQTMTTNESAGKIREATGLITSIAEETNLLSLNASIEAARAGEAGRGFAVVASQIQKLAEQSNDSARQIEEIITSLIEDSNQSVETMAEVKRVIDAQNVYVDKTGHIFDSVIEGIDQSIQRADNIAEKTRKLDAARVSVVDIVQNLTAIAEENAASTEETSASTAQVANIVTGIADSAGQLKNISDDLENQIDIFKLSEKALTQLRTSDETAAAEDTNDSVQE